MLQAVRSAAEAQASASELAQEANVQAGAALAARAEVLAEKQRQAGLKEAAILVSRFHLALTCLSLTMAVFLISDPGKRTPRLLPVLEIRGSGVPQSW